MSRLTWQEVWNETREECALKRVRRCASFFCRLRGLTFRRGLGAGEGLLLVAGKLVETGTVEEVVKNPKTETGRRYRDMELH